VYLIVGLGNPGKQYRETRHNIGFQVISLWSRGLEVRLSHRRFGGLHTTARFQGKKLILLCPLTYMNESGRSVRQVADYYGLKIGNLLVVHDDIDLPVGRIKVAPDGGAGGHKGVASIIQHLGDSNFPRVKIGAGRPRYLETVEDYVLSPFYGDQKDTMEKVIHLAVRACELFVSEGIQPAMTHINCQNLADKEERS
jgi:PTH1 family peptidyl-tRNA hydrolase